jgi:hypothetical protein
MGEVTMDGRTHRSGFNDLAMVELPLGDVHADPQWNCRRRPYTTEEIELARLMFEQHPMLHPPTVARLDDGRWWLVCGFLRFEVWRAQEREIGLFRRVEGSMRELAMLNFAENFGRRDLRPDELVARVADLMQLGYSANEIAARCGKSARYVRQLAVIRRDACPELWDAFCGSQDNRPDQGDRRALTVRRMLDLVTHGPADQMRRWRQSASLDEQADSEARGFAFEHLDSVPAHTRDRRRFPPRRRVERVLRVLRGEPSLNTEFRAGAIAALEWVLYQTSLAPIAAEHGAARSEEISSHPTKRSGEA